jgi:hypothetical protein
LINHIAVGRSMKRSATRARAAKERGIATQFKTMTGLDVRFGSAADILTLQNDVRSTPNNGHGRAPADVRFVPILLKKSKIEQRRKSRES